MLFMRKMDIAECKRISYGTLAYFADFCEAHHLRYFLAYGTLLGAVRHGGFIPWDDDIDVWMFRADYDKLLLTYQDEIEDDLYELYAIEINPACWLHFGKLGRKDTVLLPPAPYPKEYVRRCAIDIFPLDALAASDDEAMALAEYGRFWEMETRIARRYHCGMGTGLKKLLKAMVFQAATLRYGDYTLRMRAWARMLADRSCQGTAPYVTCIGAPRFYRKEWFQESVKLKFEDRLFDAPVGYDAILRRTYGDYMTPPPLKEREAHHISKAYYIDR